MTLKFQRRSPLTGKVNVLDLPVTLEQVMDFERGMLVQDAFPNLEPHEREFILTGYTKEDWEKISPKDEEEN